MRNIGDWAARPTSEAKVYARYLLLVVIIVGGFLGLVAGVAYAWDYHWLLGLSVTLVLAAFVLGWIFTEDD